MHIDLCTPFDKFIGYFGAGIVEMFGFGMKDLHVERFDIQTSPFVPIILSPIDYTVQSLLGIAGWPSHALVSFAESFEPPISLFAAFAQAYEHFAVRFAAFVDIAGYSSESVE